MIANPPPPHLDIISKPTTRFHFKAIVYILVTLFGLGTWTNISGIYIELPLLVSTLPESWQLPAKLGLLINLANIVPIVIVFASLIFKLNTASFEVPVNFVLLFTSIILAIAFAFLWDKTAYLFGANQSIALMSLCFISAIADCLSSTTFIPFLHRYEPVYLNAFFTGEALTALLPALFGLGQGIGKSNCVLLDYNLNGTLIEVHHPPYFSIRTYFLLLSSLPFIALLAFATLRLMKTGRSTTTTTEASMIVSKHHQSRIFILMDNIEDVNIIQNTINTINKIEDRVRNEQKKKNQLRKFFMSEQGIYLFIIFQCSAMLYGACNGLTTFSLNAYSATTFHYTIIAGQMAYPIMTLIGAFIPEVSSKIIYLLYTISTGLFIYIFITAKMSPCPPLVNQIFGHVIIFFVWVFIYLTCSYIRILMGNYFRKNLGHRGLIWFGVATQIGSLVGAFITYILANSFQLFKERNICDKNSQCF